MQVQGSGGAGGVHEERVGVEAVGFPTATAKGGLPGGEGGAVHAVEEAEHAAGAADEVEVVVDGQPLLKTAPPT